MDRGAWRATVHGVAKSWTPLSSFLIFFSTGHQSSALGQGAYLFHDLALSPLKMVI